MTLTETENKVLKTAAEHLGIVAEILAGKRELRLEDKLSDLFSDSLEYLDFILQLGVPDEVVARAETLGDLANALIHPN